jgi:transposase-like protein
MNPTLAEVLKNTDIPTTAYRAVQRVLEHQATIAEAAEFLQVDAVTLEAWCKSWLTPCVTERFDDDDLEQWERITNEERSASLVKELARELGPGHILFGWVKSGTARALAQSCRFDDVLFYSPREQKLAQVHLTWKQERDPCWPHTTLFDGWSPWLQSRLENMAPHQRRKERNDHIGFGES